MTPCAMESISIRCNRVEPRCDKCESIGADCIYRPRKPRRSRPKKQEVRAHDSASIVPTAVYRNDISENNVLIDVLNRLKRLEEHCGLEKETNTAEHADHAVLRSSVDSDTSRATVSDKSHSATPSGVIGCILSRIKDPESRALLLTNVFSHLRAVESCLFQNETCMLAIAAALSEIEHLQNTSVDQGSPSHAIPKDLTRKFIQSYYDTYQFEGFKIPLEKSFLLSMPDLLENPHVQLDYTSQIIYHSLCLQGVMLDPSSHNDNGGLVGHLYRKCLTLADRWLDHVQNTSADLCAAMLMASTVLHCLTRYQMSMALEGCNSELAWKMLGHAFTIAKALGYFFVDGNPDEAEGQPSPPQGSTIEETETDKNRKRFVFWHLLRTDCLFRLSFGKPTLIQPGTWKVNLPDPTIDGVGDESSRFIQIHFLASMRLALVVMKYLDWVDLGPDSNSVSHDATIDSFIEEVQLIMRDWDTDELLRMAKTQADTWFCVDMIFSSYKILITLHQSKKSGQGTHRLAHQSVHFSRKSIQAFQSLLGSTLDAYWGISLHKFSLVLIHQFIPFFILCLDIIGNDDHEDIDSDLPLVSWINDHVEKIVNERVELRPVMIVMKAMVTACNQVARNREAC
ncbi:hypothetical protein F1880_008729 [Penicillium rolfsii]|nr:hypothetical protein F1880_008729 [Penicillium rolfsii]